MLRRLDITDLDHLNELLVELLADDLRLPLGHQLRPQLEQGEDDAGQDEDDAVDDAQVDGVVVGHGDGELRSL